MSRQTQGSMLLVGVIAGGITVVAFLVLMVLGDMTFSPAAFLSLLVGAGAALVLFRGFHDRMDEPEATRAAHAAAVEAAAKAARDASPVESPSEPVQAPKSDPEPAPEAAPVAGISAPAKLDGPRGGEADDLKKIKGVGPKLEALLNRMGFYHYDQVANWSEDEVAWVDENLEGFKGRVSRDDWVAQARTLAGGGETEFSKKVEKGDVY